MAERSVLKYPHPILREPCAPVTTWDSALQKLIDDMTETLYASPGAVGLAANQVGESVRVILLDVTSKGDRSAFKILINPTITAQSRNKFMREGCLSFPDYLANIKRATNVTFTAYDREECLQTYTVRGLEAVAIQHEIDHLDGIVMLDRIQSLKTDWIRRQAKLSPPKDLTLPEGTQSFQPGAPSDNKPV
ncbi:MAG: peptide deformylase [Cyanobacteria bacterium P01_H01_bin.74]